MDSSGHEPVLLAEVVEALQPRPGGRYCDGTVGAGGHAAALLRASAPDGWLGGCDRDGTAVGWARERLAEFAGRFELRQGSFAELGDWVAAGSCDGVLADLGVNSRQLDDGARGFSFRLEGPLDMRFDPRQEPTAAWWVNEAAVDDLARLFRELGDEPAAWAIARAIGRERQRGPLTTTLQLADLVARVVPRRGRPLHPATRVFQALRIAVNDELGELERGLDALWKLLRVGGRLAVIAFHSGEDRRVKAFGRARARDYVIPGERDVPELRQPCAPQARWVTRKALQPGAVETARNPRARSARLRVLEKIGPASNDGATAP